MSRVDISRNRSGSGLRVIDGCGKRDPDAVMRDVLDWIVLGCEAARRRIDARQARYRVVKARRDALCVLPGGRTD